MATDGADNIPRRPTRIRDPRDVNSRRHRTRIARAVPQLTTHSELAALLTMSGDRPAVTRLVSARTRRTVRTTSSRTRRPPPGRARRTRQTSPSLTTPALPPIGDEHALVITENGERDWVLSASGANAAQRREGSTRVSMPVSWALTLRCGSGALQGATATSGGNQNQTLCPGEWSASPLG